MIGRNTGHEHTLARNEHPAVARRHAGGYPLLEFVGVAVQSGDLCDGRLAAAAEN